MGAARKEVKKRTSVGRRLALLFVLLAGSAVGSYFLVPELLSRAGRFLISEIEPRPSDAIVILGGGGIDRAREAAELYRAGLAPRVLLTSEEVPSTYRELQRMGIELVPPRENDIRILRGLGVPDGSILRIERTSAETMDELYDLRDYAASREWRRLIVVTSNFHTRRAGLIARHVFGEEWDVGVVGSRYSDYRADSWWRRPGDLRTFVIEFQKLIAYEIWLLPRMLF